MPNRITERTSTRRGEDRSDGSDTCLPAGRQQAMTVAMQEVPAFAKASSGRHNHSTPTQTSTSKKYCEPFLS